MTTPVDGDAFARAHARLRADASLQFDLPVEKPTPPPAWLDAVIAFFRDYGWLIKPTFYAMLIALGLWLLWKLAVPLYRRWSEREGPSRLEPEWRPEASAARKLLEEADALARDGRYGEAAHLLLFRSIEDIDARRPDLLRPALTSREIVSADLPHAAKGAFGTIAALVERSLFAARPPDASGWTQARGAYAELAGEGSWR